MYLFKLQSIPCPSSAGYRCDQGRALSGQALESCANTAERKKVGNAETMAACLTGSGYPVQAAQTQGSCVVSFEAH